MTARDANSPYKTRATRKMLFSLFTSGINNTSNNNNNNNNNSSTTTKSRHRKSHSLDFTSWNIGVNHNSSNNNNNLLTTSKRGSKQQQEQTKDMQKELCGDSDSLCDLPKICITDAAVTAENINICPLLPVVVRPPPLNSSSRRFQSAPLPMAPHSPVYEMSANQNPFTLCEETPLVLDNNNDDNASHGVSTISENSDKRIMCILEWERKQREKMHLLQQCDGAEVPVPVEPEVEYKVPTEIVIVSKITAVMPQAPPPPPPPLSYTTPTYEQRRKLVTTPTRHVHTTPTPLSQVYTTPRQYPTPSATMQQALQMPTMQQPSPGTFVSALETHKTTANVFTFESNVNAMLAPPALDCERKHHRVPSNDSRPSRVLTVVSNLLEETEHTDRNAKDYQYYYSQMEGLDMSNNTDNDYPSIHQLVSDENDDSAAVQYDSTMTAKDMLLKYRQERSRKRWNLRRSTPAVVIDSSSSKHSRVKSMTTVQLMENTNGCMA